MLDGLQLAALALGAERAVVAVRETARGARAALAAALAERAAAGRDRVPVELFPVPYGFVAGEERAVLNALAGGPAVPTLRRPWEGARPALVQNVETLAHLALISARGPRWFRAAGTAAEPGTTLVTRDGAVVRELPLGIPLRDLMRSDASRALLVGGYAGGWVDGAAAGRARLSEADLRPLGATVGCGAIVALPAGGCGVAETVRLMRWLAGESAGQCGPCRYGLDAIASALEPLCTPRRPSADPLPQVRRWCGQVAGRGACRHPDGALRMLASALRVFAAEFDDHVRHGACERCAAPSVLPLPARAAGARGGGGMSRERLEVDPIACAGHGLCAELLPELIELDDWGYPMLVDGGELPPELAALARRAADACPTLALHRRRIAAEAATRRR